MCILSLVSFVLRMLYLFSSLWTDTTLYMTKYYELLEFPKEVRDNFTFTRHYKQFTITDTLSWISKWIFTTPPVQDRFVLQIGRHQSNITVLEFSNRFENIDNVKVSKTTIKKRLRQGGLRITHLLRHQPLSRGNRVRRLEWVTEDLTFSQDQCASDLRKDNLAYRQFCKMFR